MRNNNSGKKSQRGRSPSTQEENIASDNWGVDWIPSDAQIRQDEVNLKAMRQGSDQRPRSEPQAVSKVRGGKRRKKLASDLIR